MKNEEAQKLYIEFMELQERVQELQHHLEAMSEQLTNIEKTKETIKALQELKTPTESWVQLAPGAYTKATVQPNDTILLNIGSNTAVEKTPEQVLATLTEHKQALEALREEAFKEFTQAITKLETIKEQVEASDSEAS